MSEELEKVERLRELVRVITARDFDETAFYMSIPARPNHDADCVISWAANKIESDAERIAELKSKEIALEKAIKIVSESLRVSDKEIESLRAKVERIAELAAESLMREAVAALSPVLPDQCKHKWIDPSNKAVDAGKYRLCLKCNSIAIPDSPVLPDDYEPPEQPK